MLVGQGTAWGVREQLLQSKCSAAGLAASVLMSIVPLHCCSWLPCGLDCAAVGPAADYDSAACCLRGASAAAVLCSVVRVPACAAGCAASDPDADSDSDARDGSVVLPVQQARWSPTLSQISSCAAANEPVAFRSHGRPCCHRSLEGED